MLPFGTLIGDEYLADSVGELLSMVRLSDGVEIDVTVLDFDDDDVLREEE